MSDALVRSLSATLQRGGSLSSLATARTDARLAARAAREHWLLLDVSGSMNDPVAGVRRIDALRDVVDAIAGGGAAYRQMVFADAPVERRDIPEPDGGTRLHLALDALRRAGAGKVVLVSDGHPDDLAAALAAAAALGAPIDVFYVGPPGGEGADFLRRLATMTSGAYQQTDLGRPAQRAALASAATTALKALPAPTRALRQ